MADRPAFWPKFTAMRTPKPESPDPLLAQEDPESRAAIEHYLHLADSVLGAYTPEKKEQEEKAA